MYVKKEKISVNLVRKRDEEYYRVLDNQEMFRLKCTGKVVAEGKMSEDSKFIASYYIEMD